MPSRFLLGVSLLAWSVASVLADRTTLDPTKTHNALPLATAPTIDGVIDAEEWTRAGGSAADFWSVTIGPGADNAPVVLGGAIGDAGTVPADNADLSFSIYAGYDAENLYVAVKVKDNVLTSDNAEAGSENGTTWMDDSVEIFLDGDNSNFPNRDTSGTNPEVMGTGGQFVITVNNAYRQAEAGNPGFGEGAAWYAQTKALDDGSGYVSEFRISLKTLGNPKAGDIIGFTVGVNDDDSGGGAQRQVVWVGRPHTEVTYGNLILGQRTYTAVKEAAAPTTDGVILPGEYAGAQRISVGPSSGLYDLTAGERRDSYPDGDLRFEAWAVHTAEAIYVAVDVIDDNVVTDSAEAGSENGTTWEDDSVELFFDADRSRDAGRGTLPFEGQYVLTGNGAWRTQEANGPTRDTHWTGTTTRSFRGYQAEYKVMKSALGSPADGAILGFTIAVNDDDGAGRKAQLGWVGRAHSEYTYGDLVLGGNATLPVTPPGRSILDPTKTHNALPLATAPTIDGVIDAEEWTRAGGSASDFWSVTIGPGADNAPVVLGGAIGDAGTVPADNADLSFSIYAGYDAENLYVAVKVKDNVLTSDNAEAGSENGTTWMDDSVEIFLDGDNSNYPNRDTSGTNPEVMGTGGQFVITVNNAYRQAEAGNPGFGEGAAWYAQTKALDDGSGYVSEFRISLKTLGNPKAGDIIGFTVGVNDDDSGGGAQRQVVWVGRPHTEVTYGNLILGQRTYTAVKEAAAPTTDGVILPGEYAGAQRISVGPSSGLYDLTAGERRDSYPDGDLRFEAWAVHTAEAIYVAVDVIDDNVVTDSAEAGSENGTTWEDDSVELFFDADRSRDAGRGTLPFEGQYVLTGNGAWRTQEANGPTRDTHWTGTTTRSFRGYQAEYKVMKSALGSPADGAILGFTIAVNDDDGAGRKAQLGWVGRAHSEYTYGDLVLAGSGGGGGGTVRITKIAVSGANLELTVTTSNAAGTHVVQRTPSLASPQWTDVAGTTSQPGNAGTITLRFPKPAGSPEFYRVGLR